MIWTEQRIVEKLRQLHKDGKGLSYSTLARKMQPLVSAAAYHFGSYRRAVERAGIDYADVLRRPRWSKQEIISVIKKARRDGIDLHWASVTRRRDELGKAAFASLQKRLFGSWDRALHGAGLDAEDVSRYRRWSKSAILFDLKSLHSAGEALNSGAMQGSEPGLHAAAVRHFGSYDTALQSAGIKPSSVRRRRNWTRDDVTSALRLAGKGKQSVSDASLRKSHPALYGASLRLFGTLAKARSAAGLKPASK